MSCYFSFPFWNCSLFVYQVQHALKKSEKALDTLNKAINIDPKNPLCKFHRASVLFANEKYKVSLGARGSLEIPGAGNWGCLGNVSRSPGLAGAAGTWEAFPLASATLSRVAVNVLVVIKSGAARCCFLNYYFSLTHCHEFSINF